MHPSCDFPTPIKHDWQEEAIVKTRMAHTKGLFEKIVLLVYSAGLRWSKDVFLATLVHNFQVIHSGFSFHNSHKAIVPLVQRNAKMESCLR